MADEKPYSLLKFIGVKSFKQLLEEAGITYMLFEDESVPLLFKGKAEYFIEAEDSITVGKCLQDNVDVYFAEFGIKITTSFRSYIVFIFDHHPTVDDMLATADDLEPLIQEHLEGIDLGDMKQ